MKINKMVCVGVMLLVNACSMHAGAAALMAALPKKLSVAVNVNIQKANQTCFGKVENTITTYAGGTSQIVFGDCTEVVTQSQGAESQGKYGDITVIPTTGLNKIDLGNVSTVAQRQFYLPQPSSLQNNVVGWNNALLFAFKPSNPLANSKWANAIQNPLKGREYQVIVRLVNLTQALAQTTSQMDAFNNVKNPILIEFWTQINPSVSGSKAAKQIFDLVADGSTLDYQAPLLFSASPDGKATISYAVIDQGDNQQKVVSTSFNVGEVAP